MNASLGEFEILVLAGTIMAFPDASGMTIHENVRALAAPRSVSVGSVYTTLGRLASKRYVSTWMGDPTKKRGGRSRRMYKIKNSGAAALGKSMKSMMRVLTVLEQHRL